ncbi:endoplasmic oxidoreductin-1 [Coemansia sp. RSA 376]|nr:endoplasmic oxidoreductin-1 [Coemansia sp. S3946]KAJ2071563.1 endoplasmic oxidoreductin-1 [Coemansia sp. S155-1]KAJ2115610.1 endoplasmic oxidoreductin-1 [Coemansia sp. RSA 922]KAJ2262766.1 endoplasmic oxidoreductin-1 [Coemansia sp. RSA 376]KAJ2422410.1 endoplasmic oxidoreductin-1 [Coemansia sp. RSA 2531]
MAKTRTPPGSTTARQPGDDTPKPARPRWIWTVIRITALVAAAATAYIARDSPRVLGFSSSSQDPPKQPPSQNVGFMAQVLQKSKGQNICKPEGFVMDTYSDFDGIEALNRRVAVPLRKLIKTKFFRTLRVELYKPCQFWKSEGSCFQRDCIVQPLEDDQIPAAWRKQTVDQTNFGPFLRPEFTDKDFAIVNDETYGEGVWLDLVENPERFTGYAGAGANAIWMSIYEHNCFGVPPYIQDTAGGWGSQLVNVDGKSMPFVQPPRKQRDLAPFLESLAEEDAGLTLPADVPKEYRIFYRAVSGLHASTSTHICADYFNATSNKWEPNLNCFIARIGAFPDRLQNIYFNFVLLTRALQKMEPYLAAYDYSTNAKKEDRAVARLIPKLLKTVKKAGLVFDDSELFLAANGRALKAEFKDNFRNISRIMDCTGCEKCRLWGKTQTLGIGTALKALFSYPDRAFRGRFTSLDFKRNEIVALITTYFQFSRSIEDIGIFRAMYQNLVTDWRASNAVPTIA